MNGRYIEWDVGRFRLWRVHKFAHFGIKFSVKEVYMNEDTCFKKLELSSYFADMWLLV
jgi:hypothetical protein